MRVAFAGTPEFAQVALAQLHGAGFEIALVLTQPDRAAGRGLRMQPSAVKQWSLARDLKVIQPQSLRLDGKFAADAQSAAEALRLAQPEVMVVAAYGLILPQWTLDLPSKGCLNIHASLLPRWRGAAPIHRAIEAGDQRTGITIMQMNAGLDTGDILLVEAVDISDRDTAISLHDRLATLGGHMVVKALNLAAKNELRPVAQPADGVTYAHKLEKAEAAVDWTRPAAQIERRIRAFDPFPGVSCVMETETFKLWKAHLVEGEGIPGAVMAVSDAGIKVACGQGALLLTELQRPGGKRLSAKQFLQTSSSWTGKIFTPRPR